MSAAVHPLDRIAIASPCSADWRDMSGDDTARHCADCDKHVFDLSAMTRAEATAFLTGWTGREPPCLRLFRRADGTVLTADCPEGLVTRARRRVLAGWKWAAALFGITVGSFNVSGCVMGVPDRDWQCEAPEPALRPAPRELARDLHELVPAHELLTTPRRPPRLLPRAK